MPTSRGCRRRRPSGRARCSGWKDRQHLSSPRRLQRPSRPAPPRCARRSRPAPPRSASSAWAMSGCRWRWSLPTPDCTSCPSTWTGAKVESIRRGRVVHPRRRQRAPEAGRRCRSAARRRPISRSWPTWTPSASACRRRCARPRTPTCRTSSRPSRRCAKYLRRGPARRARVDDVSGHDRRGRAPDARARAAWSRAAISSWPFHPSASIRPTRVAHRQHAEGRRRHRPRLDRGRVRPVRHHCRHDRAGVVDRAWPRWSSCSRTRSAR